MKHLMIVYLLFISTATYAEQKKTTPIKQQSMEQGSLSIGAPSIIIGDYDSRVPITDNRIARLRTPTGTGTFICTAWLISNGAFVTAGHCIRDEFKQSTLEFDVPLSKASGKINHSKAENRYSVIGPMGQAYTEGKCTSDWAVFKGGTNNIGQTPIEKQENYFYVSDTDLAVNDTITVPGYGTNSDLPCANGTGCQPIYHDVLQQGAGVIIDSQHDYYSYNADTMPGASGAPIISDGIVVAIHHGKEHMEELNCGTRLSEEDIADNLHRFPAWAADNPVKSDNIIYISQINTGGESTGNYFTPYLSVQDGLQTANRGNTSMLVVERGKYNLKGNQTIKLDNNITFTMMVGNVTLSID